MSSQTPKLNLFKWNPEIDGEEEFNIDTALNENWDKLDEKYGEIEENIVKIKEDITSGWNKILNLTSTYVSWDSSINSGVIKFNGDITSYISAGMKLKAIQNGITKFFIVTLNPTFSSGESTLNIYGGTDYVIENLAITEIYFSTQNSPFAFPLEESKWSIVINNSTTIYGTPSSNVWWNPGNISITIPAGKWKVSYLVRSRGSATIASNALVTLSTTLSTSNSSESNVNYNSTSANGIASAGLYMMNTTFYIEFPLTLTSPTTLYLLHRIITTGSITSNENGFMGSGRPTIIKAVYDL